jgi:hypothetical protein
MWDEVDEATGAQREHDLKETFLKGIFPDGCRTERFHTTYESAWHIIGSLAGKDGAEGQYPYHLQVENVSLDDHVVL